MWLENNKPMWYNNLHKTIFTKDKHMTYNIFNNNKHIDGCWGGNQEAENDQYNNQELLV